jgi:CheY-like chemotaxis protein
MARVLMVEDNAAQRKIYLTLLLKEGYDVDFAADGQEALEKAERNPPDFILLDVRMPRLDGLGFLRAYDVRERHPDVKVVVLSNTEVAEEVEEALALGARRYLTKYTSTPRTVLALIREVLAER